MVIGTMFLCLVHALRSVVLTRLAMAGTSLIKLGVLHTILLIVILDRRSLLECLSGLG